MFKTLSRSLVNWKAVFMAVVIILALQGTSTAVQITATWNGGAGNWDTAGNWSGAVVPNNGLMRASNGGTLRALANVDIDGAGRWEADGGKIQLDSGVDVTTTGSIKGPQWRGAGVE